MKRGDAADPKRLIAEAYRIDDVGPEECRSIFLDWALSVQVDADMKQLIETLLERHGADGHPMTEVLRDGLHRMDAPRRRGGWRSRPRN